MTNDLIMEQRIRSYFSYSTFLVCSIALLVLSSHVQKTICQERAANSPAQSPLQENNTSLGDNKNYDNSNSVLHYIGIIKNSLISPQIMAECIQRLKTQGMEEDLTDINYLKFLSACLKASHTPLSFANHVTGKDTRGFLELRSIFRKDDSQECLLNTTDNTLADQECRSIMSTNIMSLYLIQSASSRKLIHSPREIAGCPMNSKPWSDVYYVESIKGNADGYVFQISKNSSCEMLVCGLCIETVPISLHGNCKIDVAYSNELHFVLTNLEHSSIGYIYKQLPVVSHHSKRNANWVTTLATQARDYIVGAEKPEPIISIGSISPDGKKYINIPSTDNAMTVWLKCGSSLIDKEYTFSIGNRCYWRFHTYFLSWWFIQLCSEWVYYKWLAKIGIVLFGVWLLKKLRVYRLISAPITYTSAYLSYLFYVYWPWKCEICKNISNFWHNCHECVCGTSDARITHNCAATSFSTSDDKNSKVKLLDMFKTSHNIYSSSITNTVIFTILSILLIPCIPRTLAKEASLSLGEHELKINPSHILYQGSDITSMIEFSCQHFGENSNSYKVSVVNSKNSYYYQFNIASKCYKDEEGNYNYVEACKEYTNGLASKCELVSPTCTSKAEFLYLIASDDKCSAITELLAYQNARDLKSEISITLGKVSSELRDNDTIISSKEIKKPPYPTVTGLLKEIMITVPLAKNTIYSDTKIEDGHVSDSYQTLLVGKTLTGKQEEYSFDFELTSGYIANYRLSSSKSKFAVSMSIEIKEVVETYDSRFLYKSCPTEIHDYRKECCISGCAACHNELANEVPSESKSVYVSKPNVGYYGCAGSCSFLPQVACLSAYCTNKISKPEDCLNVYRLSNPQTSVLICIVIDLKRACLIVDKFKTYNYLNLDLELFGDQQMQDLIVAYNPLKLLTYTGEINQKSETLDRFGTPQFNVNGTMESYTPDPKYDISCAADSNGHKIDFHSCVKDTYQMKSTLLEHHNYILVDKNFKKLTSNDGYGKLRIRIPQEYDEINSDKKQGKLMVRAFSCTKSADFYQCNGIISSTSVYQTKFTIKNCEVRSKTILLSASNNNIDLNLRECKTRPDLYIDDFGKLMKVPYTTNVVSLEKPKQIDEFTNVNSGLSLTNSIWELTQEAAHGLSTFFYSGYNSFIAYSLHVILIVIIICMIIYLLKQILINQFYTKTKVE